MPQALLRPTNLKCSAFFRCFKEFGVYLEEVKGDGQRLEQLRTEGRDTRQQEQVMKETLAMVTLMEEKTTQLGNDLIEEWKLIADDAKADLDSAEEEDEARVQLVKDIREVHSRLRTVLATVGDHNCLRETPLEGSLKRVLEEMGVLINAHDITDTFSYR